MKFVTDLHLHSKYSRAVSQDMVFGKMAEWAKFKGIQVLATGDFTHPFWFDQIKNELEEAGNGLYKLKSVSDKSQVISAASLAGSDISEERHPCYAGRRPADISDKVNDRQDVYFLLSCEVSSIYSQGGKGRRIHNLFFFPSLESVEKFNGQLLKRGANLRSDGRPIVGLTSRDLAEVALECDQKTLIIPAHIWTPWFSVFGSFSGFDSLEECFGDMTDYVFAIETGLSSDPAMNWRVADLDRRAILSFSDAHSLEKIGREATVFEASKISYDSIYQAIRNATGNVTRGPKIAFTIEFYPEEGKYHYTGHRDCNFSQSPQETAKSGTTCPVCGRKLTVGVMHRVEELATVDAKFEIRNSNGVKQVYSGGSSRSPYVSLVPLSEILAEALGVGVGTKTVMDTYLILVNQLGNEFNVLLKAELSDISRLVSSNVVEAIEKVRSRDIVVVPGYDGKFGQVKIWPSSEKEGKMQVEEEKQKESQLNLFAS